MKCFLIEYDCAEDNKLLNYIKTILDYEYLPTKFEIISTLDIMKKTKGLYSPNNNVIVTSPINNAVYMSPYELINHLKDSGLLKC